MNHRDNFPPNKFLMKTIMKTPGRFMLYIISLWAFGITSVMLFPKQAAVVAIYGLAIWCPFMLAMMVWNIIWTIKNPTPPAEKCGECHQALPENENE